jgi:hypothetical protein
MTETQLSIEERIRGRAYLLWLEEDRPHGRDQDHWEKARRLVEQEETDARSSTFTHPVLATGEEPKTKRKRSPKIPKK